ncbi:MAG TPA: tetratricopeptide repeat protein [Gemmataceae bacterium]|jgi:tetratricopeptide (TPR) repeat protein|nr:tetratricopeptide repeat protein [Gemmataceae bacterium]
MLFVVAALGSVEAWAFWQERAARQAVAAEHFDEAQRHVNLALRVRSRSADLNLLAARIARKRGAYSEAEEYLSRCGQFNDMSEALELEWLLLRCQRSEVDELAPVLLAAVARHHSESAAILEALSQTYVRQTRYLEALSCLDDWVELAPDCVRALDLRGWVNNQLDHRGQAITDYERALELQPERSAVRLRLAQVLADSSRHAEAIPHLERLRAEQPDNPAVLVLLARCWWQGQGYMDEARSLLDSVLTAHPTLPDAQLQRGQLELFCGNYSEAEPWLRQALGQMPHDPEVRYALYLSLEGQGDKQREAEQELTQWQQDRKLRDRLTRLLRTELGAHPRNPDLAEETGELLLQLGEDQRGFFWLQRALALDPRHAASHRALIAYYERTNHPSLAEEHRRKLAALGQAP